MNYTYNLILTLKCGTMCTVKCLRCVIHHTAQKKTHHLFSCRSRFLSFNKVKIYVYIYIYIFAIFDLRKVKSYIAWKSGIKITYYKDHCDLDSNVIRSYIYIYISRYRYILLSEKN